MKYETRVTKGSKGGEAEECERATSVSLNYTKHKAVVSFGCPLYKRFNEGEELQTILEELGMIVTSGRLSRDTYSSAPTHFLTGNE